MPIYNDKTMNPMKHNGKPQINDEDTPLKSTNPLKLFKPVQSGDSGSWKKDETINNEILSFYGRQKSIDNNVQEGQSYLNGEEQNGTTQKDDNNSRHSKFYDPNGNSTQSSGIDSVESNPSEEDEEMAQTGDDRVDEPVSVEHVKITTQEPPSEVAVQNSKSGECEKARQLVTLEKSQMQALCNQRRAAQLIERILTIRTRLMDPFSFAGRAELKKIRRIGQHQHLDGVTPRERAQLPPLAPPVGQSAASSSVCETTDESENEEDDFQVKMGHRHDHAEHKQIRAREKAEEEKSTIIESRRIWLLRRIQQCDKQKMKLAKSNEEEEEKEEEDDSGESCARSRVWTQKKKKKKRRIVRREQNNDHAKTGGETSDGAIIGRLDHSYHHVLSTPRSVPLSVRLTTILHEVDPGMRLDLLKKPNSKRGHVDLLREKKRKKDKKRLGDSLNQIVVPPSSLITSIEMPKYKNIDVPGYRSDETPDSTKEEEDEDISHEAYVRRHMISEKAEKMRYYQSAIANSRKRKKQQIDPRIASPIAESYVIKECGGESSDLLIGYKKHDYPISPAQIGEFGYTGDVVSVPSKKKRQKKQEWQSSPCTEGAGGGLRLKLSLRKL